MNPFEEIVSLNLPAAILADIEKRITDWLASGGKDDDLYIEQQLRYARNVSTAIENKRNGDRKLNQINL